MKKLVSILITLAMLLTVCSAFASTIDSFQPYTDVKLDVFKSAGWNVYIDEWKFNAEISPANNKIEWKDIGGTYVSTSYDLSFDVKVIYSAGHCTLIPRIIFHREGYKSYADGSLANVYIRIGENRYKIDTRGGSRYTDSKNYSASDSCVEPMGLKGLVLLQDLAETTQPVSMYMGDYADTVEFTSDNLAMIKAFYDTCKEAGIFDQAELIALSDGYSIITLFNENSPKAEETVEATEEPAEPESEPAE